MIRANRFLVFAALLFIVLGARLWLIAGYGSSLPIHDQWDAEAAFLFKPWLEGHLTWQDLLAPHNEHRIVPSRLLALGLLRLNGQWDAQLEMAANAILCGLIGLLTLRIACRCFPSEKILHLFTAVTLWLALPYAQENTLWGFQSCFYFMLIFSLGALWGLGFHRVFSFQWWIGWVSAFLACLSMASGFLAAAVVVFVIAIRCIKRRAWIPEQLGTLVTALAILALGFFLRHDFPQHAALKASSPLAWADFFGRCLAWPFCEIAPAGLLIYWPICWLGISYFKAGGSTPYRAERDWTIELLVGTAAWVVLQAAAIAYSRGGNGTDEVASRYMDVLALGALVNMGAVAVLLTTYPRRKTVVFWCYLWIAIVGGGAAMTSYRQVSSQAGRQAWLRIEERNVRAYVATGDKTYFQGDEPRHIPYPDDSRLAGLLDNPGIREILPAAVRRPLRVEPEVNDGGCFVDRGYRPEIADPPYEHSWGSYSARGEEARGTMATAIFTSRLSYLEIEIAGYLREGMTLDLQSEDGRKQARFVPTMRIDGSWRGGFLPLPSARARLIARDENTHDWFAFREPREVGRYSVYAERLVANGRLLCTLGLLSFLGPFVHLLLKGITNRAKA